MARRRREERDAFVCPCCGHDVPVGASACRECGASDEFGWDEGDWWEDELPTGYAEDSDEDEEYDRIIAEEFPDRAAPGHRARRWMTAAVVVLVCLGLLAWALGGR